MRLAFGLVGKVIIVGAHIYNYYFEKAMVEGVLLDLNSKPQGNEKKQLFSCRISIHATRYSILDMCT